MPAAGTRSARFPSAGTSPNRGTLLMGTFDGVGSSMRVKLAMRGSIIFWPVVAGCRGMLLRAVLTPLSSKLNSDSYPSGDSSDENNVLLLMVAAVTTPMWKFLAVDMMLDRVIDGGENPHAVFVSSTTTNNKDRTRLLAVMMMSPQSSYGRETAAVLSCSANLKSETGITMCGVAYSRHSYMWAGVDESWAMSDSSCMANPPRSLLSYLTSIMHEGNSMVEAATTKP